ncbi:hypothetical protein NDN08_006717 [Rhodosorus marinus]|uniref:(S)-ureidoglycine aminohydrolase n=1 Tax=Rhodosorus marinus TaxID=101924 RepID=A0AAV8UID5_9RHOD|nr:hypothetical protein NDN08_006717 [Rhodosorus marinus]
MVSTELRALVWVLVFAIIGYATVFAAADATVYEQIRASRSRSWSFFSSLPGATRSVVRDNYALVTPESHVYADLPGWPRIAAACLISPAMGSHFSMYLAFSSSEVEVKGCGSLQDVERFIYVIEGEVVGPNDKRLQPGGFAYIPAGESDAIFSIKESSVFLVYDRQYQSMAGEGVPPLIVDHQDNIQVEVPDGEVFRLRRLLPMSKSFDFNIHVMDFDPGEFLNVKEVHYNQHGLLLLTGMGVYRLGDDYIPVTAGDAIYMAPFVPQWFGALGKEISRYIIYKDTNRNPLFPSATCV